MDTRNREMKMLTEADHKCEFREKKREEGCPVSASTSRHQAENLIQTNLFSSTNMNVIIALPDENSSTNIWTKSGNGDTETG